MTYAELIAELMKLTPEQREQQVYWAGDERGGKICGLHILEEDFVDVDGDGLEPLSTYLEGARLQDEPPFDLADVTYHAPKGTVYLTADDVGALVAADFGG